MGTLMPALVAAASVFSGSPAPIKAIDPIARWRPMVAEASARFGIPAGWIERVMRAESGGWTMLRGKPIRSTVGAIGLMQVMPTTWAAMRIACRLGIDPDDPHDNIIAGTAYLRLMVDRFGYPGAFAAYNAGPDRYAAYLAGRSRLPADTIAYLAGITGGRSVAVAMPPRQLLFSLRRDLVESPASAAVQHAGDSLFAIRKGLPR